MIKNASPNGLSKSLLEEHKALEKKIADLHSWIHEVTEIGVPHFRELGVKLESVRDSLKKHFAIEEEQGYLAEALAGRPQLKEEANALQKQHAQFLKQLDTLICKLEGCERPFESWQEACNEFESFLVGLKEHEVRETDILQFACQDD